MILKNQKKNCSHRFCKNLPDHFDREVRWTNLPFNTDTVAKWSLFTSTFLPKFRGLCFFFSSAFPFCTFSSNSSTSSFKSRFLSACAKILEFHQSVMHRQMSSKKIHGGFGIPFRKTCFCGLVSFKTLDSGSLIANSHRMIVKGFEEKLFSKQKCAYNYNQYNYILYKYPSYKISNL